MILLFCIFIGIVTGCGSKEKESVQDKTVTCTLSQNFSSYEIKSTYTIYSKGDAVDKVEISETATSDNEEIINSLETAFNAQYTTLNNKYNGYTNTVTKNGSKVENKATADYNEIDINKFIEDNELLKEYVNSDNRLTLNGIIAFYEGNNATCEK